MVNKIALNVGRSLAKEPCTYAKLQERPFLKNVSLLGVEQAERKLYKAGIIDYDDNDVMFVNEKFLKDYEGEVENIH